MACASRALAVALAALAACSAEQALPPPAPATIEPAIGYNAFALPVTIRGADFHVRAEHSVEGAAGTRVLAGFRAWLGDTELLDVVRVDAATITATIPVGIPGGAHELVVEGPYATRGSVPAAYVALATPPPVLTSTVAPVRERVAVGDEALLDVTVTNLGPGSLAEVRPNVKRVVDGARRVPLAAPLPIALAEGASFTWRYAEPALEPGTLVYEAKASAVEVVTGAALASQKAGATIQVETALPALKAVLRATGPDPAVPAALPVGATVTLTLAVENVGEGTATNVRPGALAFDPRHPLAGGAVASATPPFDLAPGAAGAIVWRLDAAEAGVFAVTCSAEGDAGAAASASTGAAISSEVAVVAWDPLGGGGGESAAAALLARAGGDLVVGPDASGTRFARVGASGDGLEAIGLGVARDEVGPNVAANALALEGDHPTLGAAGCEGDGVPHTCGPDGEVGSGLLASGPLGGEDWLVYGGARDRGLDYVYLAREAGAALAFAYVDLSAVLPATVEALSAALPAGDKLYLGFAAPDRPALVALRSPPGGGGLDAAAADATDLGLEAALATVDLAVPPAPPGRLATVDALQHFGGRLYVFGSFGCLVASDAAPAGPVAFASCTRPSAKVAVAPPDARGIRPGERAYPQVAIWGGRLLAARNTADGPQLLACDAAGGADPDACEPGDWRLVGPNVAAVLDASLTQLDDPANERIALLLATERHLYVGFEGAAGLRVYRTASTTLSGYVELRGEGGAAAGPGTPGLGGDGLGLGATRVYGALTAPDPVTGAPAPLLLVGDGAGPVRLVRLLE